MVQPAVAELMITARYSSDGPSGDLIIDQAGALYGTTSGGSLGGLVVSGLETVLHSFSGADGDIPYKLATARKTRAADVK
jgi:hypothetical protein